MAKIAGTCYIKVNGKSYDLRGSMNISLGEFERQSVVGQDGYHGIIEKPRASFIECDLTDNVAVDIKELDNITGATVTVELINGKTGVLRDATQVKAIELTAEDGKMSVRFEGPRGEWINE